MILNFKNVRLFYLYFRKLIDLRAILSYFNLDFSSIIYLGRERTFCDKWQTHLNRLNYRLWLIIFEKKKTSENIQIEEIHSKKIVLTSFGYQAQNLLMETSSMLRCNTIFWTYFPQLCQNFDLFRPWIPNLYKKI